MCCTSAAGSLDLAGDGGDGGVGGTSMSSSKSSMPWSRLPGLRAIIMDCLVRVLVWIINHLFLCDSGLKAGKGQTSQFYLHLGWGPVDVSLFGITDIGCFCCMFA